MISILRRWVWLVLPWAAACQSPMKPIQRDILVFENQHSENFKSYQVGQRSMRLAWNGSPKLRPLVFVHGSPGSWKAWAKFLLDSELLKHFQVIAVDRPGYGGSGAGHAEPSLSEQAKDIVASLAINESGLPAIWVGHSMGSPVVARIAMDFPQNTAGVVFVAASVSPALEKTKWFQYPGRWWPIRVLIPGDLRVCNEEIFALKSELEQMLPLWDSIIAPVAILQGSEDDLVPAANQDFLLARLTQAFIVTNQRIEGLNHFIPWKRPDLILDAIKKINERLNSEKIP